MPAYLDKPTKLWRYDFRVKSDRYTERGFPTRRAALDAEANRRDAIVAASSAPDPYPTFKTLVDAFLATSRRTKSADWCYQLEHKLNKVFTPLAPLHPSTITAGQVEACLDRLRAEGNGGRSLNEYRKIVNSVFNFAVSRDAIDKNPARTIGKAPEDAVDVEPVPKAHLTKLILGADVRLRALLTFMSQTGARFVEAQRLTWADVHEVDGRSFAVLRTRKNRGGSERATPQPLSERALEAIAMVQGLSAEYVFAGVNGGAMNYVTELKRLQRLCRRLELPTYGFHQVRHFAGMVATQLGHSKKATAQFLRHQDTGATERYMHAAAPEVWEVVDRLNTELADVAIGVTDTKEDCG